MKGYWNNLRPFEKRVFVGVTALVFIVFNVWFVIPHFSDMTKMKTRRASAQKKLEAFRNEIAQTNKYWTEVRKLEGEGLSVPQEEQSVQFIRAIQSQAQLSAASITQFGRQTFRTNQFFLESSIGITVMSGESQLVDFLFNLGSGNSLIRVRDLTLRPDPPRQQLNSTIKLVASYQKKPTPRTVAAPAGVPKPSTPSKGPMPVVRTNPPAANTNTPALKPGNMPAIPGAKPGAATNKSNSIKRP